MTKLSFQRYLHLSLHLFLLGETSLSMLCVLLFFFSSLWSPIYICISLLGQGITSSRGVTQAFWDPSCVYPLMSCGLSSDIALIQLLVMPWQKYLVCTFIFFPLGCSLTRLSYPPQTKTYALRSRIISWVSKPRVWKGELFPCWLWPQDVKLALAFAGSNLHSTRLHCKGFFFLFISALKEKILLLSLFYGFC